MIIDGPLIICKAVQGPMGSWGGQGGQGGALGVLWGVFDESSDDSFMPVYKGSRFLAQAGGWTNQSEVLADLKLLKTHSCPRYHLILYLKGPIIFLREENKRTNLY